jgi:hypothetical protein
MGELLVVTDTLSAPHASMLTMDMAPQELAAEETSDVVSCSLLIKNMVIPSTFGGGDNSSN